MSTINLEEASKQTFKKSGRRIKISKNLKPFVSRVVRAGKVQVAFTEQIGHAVGGCVKANVRKDMSGKTIHGIAKLCAKPFAGTHLDLAAVTPAMLKRARGSVAREYFEID